MSDFPNSVGGAGSVRYINPDSLNKNPAFTNVVVEGNVKTVHIGGQDAVNASGEIVGTADFSVVDPQRMMCTYGPAEGFYSTTRTCMACVGQYHRNTL